MLLFAIMCRRRQSIREQLYTLHHVGEYQLKSNTQIRIGKDPVDRIFPLVFFRSSVTMNQLEHVACQGSSHSQRQQTTVTSIRQRLRPSSFTTRPTQIGCLSFRRLPIDWIEWTLSSNERTNSSEQIFIFPEHLRFVFKCINGSISRR